jgi:CRISPR-associated protein Csb2
METIAIEFVARRYHATPWDAHVNEGRIEWPPAPWRILRALIAVGYNKFCWSKDRPESVNQLLYKLAAVNPSYSLPKATETHTRHYMPVRDGRRDKPVKVFDAFLRFREPNDRLLIRYPVDLDESERESLANLVNGLAYLGRAESWVDAELLNQQAAAKVVEDRTWFDVATSDSKNRVRLLAAISEQEYQPWRDKLAKRAADDAEAAKRSDAEQRGGSVTNAAIKKVRAAAEVPFPLNLIASLEQDTSKWQAEGWPRPPGSRWVEYELPDDVLERGPLISLAPRPHFTRPTAILLTIDGEGKRGTLRPRMKRSLPLMELLHSESVRHADRLGLGQLPELTGKSAVGKPLRGTHLHCHWLPMSLAGNGAIDHVLIYAPGGISQAGLEAVSAIRWAYAKGIRKLSINLAGFGQVEDIARQLRQSKDAEPSSLQMFGTASVWQSVTPLVLRKYLHRRGKKTLEGQVREELRERGFPAPVEVECWPQQRLVLQRMKGFALRRQPEKNQPPFERSWGLTLRFDEPVQGPLTLGYGSHFGLGMFEAIADDP